jgi:hypothetical protein
MEETTELRAIRKSRRTLSFDVLPPEVMIVKLQGIHYAHLKTGDGGDLYVTKYGLPFLENLKPENWYEREWFRHNRERLNGTSTVYKVPTRPVGGRTIDLVVKWSRVGQDVPLETKVLDDILSAEFNSPFEEFALVESVCRERGLGVLPYFALGSGFLTGKYRSEADIAGSARGAFVKKYLNERGLRIIAALDDVAMTCGATPAKAALAWLLTRPVVTAPIASATTLGQLKDLIEATNLKIDAQSIRMLDEASRE